MNCGALRRGDEASELRVTGHDVPFSPIVRWRRGRLTAIAVTAARVIEETDTLSDTLTAGRRRKPADESAAKSQVSRSENIARKRADGRHSFSSSAGWAFDSPPAHQPPLLCRA
jgi:hypothetical protein